MVDYRILSLLMAVATVCAALTFFMRLGVWLPRATRNNSSDDSGAAIVGEPTEILSSRLTEPCLGGSLPC